VIDDAGEIGVLIIDPQRQHMAARHQPPGEIEVGIGLQEVEALVHGRRLSREGGRRHPGAATSRRPGRPAAASRDRAKVPIRDDDA
jgi:hypothetical protein